MEYPTKQAGLSDELIVEFQLLYLKQFNIQLSKDEALEQGLTLVRLIKVCTTNANEGADRDSTSEESCELHEGIERDY